MIVIALPDELSLAGNTDETALVTGFGALNVIAALQNVSRETPIHNVGYAGSNSIPVGTRCRIGLVKAYHPVAGDDRCCYYLDGDVPCYTAGDFVTSTSITEPCVFDMELAYILAMGFTNVTSEKVVSDNLSKEEFEECLKK